MCLPDLDHQWPRFVMPTGTAVVLSDGFLPDPEGRYEQYSNPKLLTTSAFFAKRCCIILGDAGIGKSHVLRTEYERVSGNGAANTNVIFQSLRDFGSDVTAKQFLNSAEIMAWTSDPDAQLYLFLDSLDEALLTVTVWSGLLIPVLEKWPIERLRLRIACRPAFWPESLGVAIGREFADEFSKATLAPLRRCDVESAAAEHSIDPVILNGEMQRSNAMTFAARPLTLKMIFGIFAKDGRLPDTHVDMYRKGCRFLAEEQNPDVIEGHNLTSVPLDRRIFIIERIAAMSVFCDRRFIQHPNASQANLPEATLTSSAICSTDVATAETREVLACALFGFQTPDVLVWTNWSYAEFLAASWCISQNLTTASIRGLISVVGDNGTGIPQQLSSTAIWMGELRRELQQYLVTLNPSLLLFIDESAVDSAILRRMVKRTVETRKTWELERQVTSYAHRFRHPDIAKQLAKYLRRPSKQRECSTALSIAIACNLSELSPEILALVDDIRVPMDLRQSAANAIAYMGTNEARLAIRHFATNPAPEDARDNIRGSALSANWPAGFTIKQILPLLTPPRHASHSGSYERFLFDFAKELPADLSSADVLDLLAWARQGWLAGNQNFCFDPLVERIIVAAWEGLDDASIRRAFVSYLLNCLRNFQPGFPLKTSLRAKNEWPERFTQNIDRRSLLLRDTLLEAEYTPYLIHSVAATLYVGSSDAELLLGLARQGNEELRRNVSVVFYGLDRENTGVLDAIYKGTLERVLDDGLSGRLVTEIGSESAQELREFVERKERQQVAVQNRLDEIQRDLYEFINRSEAGKSDAWYAIWAGVLVADWPDLGRWDATVRLENLPCWPCIDEATRTRLYPAALRFALSGTRLPLDFLGGSSWPDWAASEYGAVLISSERTPRELLGVEDQVWERWCQLAIWYPFAGIDETTRASRNWLAQRIAPFLAAASGLFDIYRPLGRCSSILDGLRFDWPSEFTRMMLQQVKRTDLQNSCWGSICAVGLAEAPQPFEYCLWTAFSQLLEGTSKAREERLVTITVLMLRHAKPGTWSRLRQLFFAEPLIAEQAMSSVSDMSNDFKWMSGLGDGELAELFIWMNRQFPPDIGHVSGASYVTDSMRIRMVRDSALVALRSRGNLKVYRSILQALPEMIWLRSELPYVEEVHFHRKWKVETPDGLLLMAAENSVPWYSKRKTQIVIVIATFIGLLYTIASFLTAQGVWRITAVFGFGIFLLLGGSVVATMVRDQRPKD
jgi:hypothetical protein